MDLAFSEESNKFSGMIEEFFKVIFRRGANFQNP
jgi:hypothetical protein